MRIRPQHIVMLALITLLGNAKADELRRLKAEVSTIAEGAAALTATKTEQPRLVDVNLVASRLNNAQVFYLSKEFSRAAIILMDLADRDGISRHPAYSDILYYLGDSLFQMANDQTAAEYLMLLKSRAKLSRREWATGRLLQICARRTDVTFCDENRMSALSKITERSLSSLKYALAKALYKHNDLANSRKVFRLISPQENEWLKATYFIGVIQIRKIEMNQETPDAEARNRQLDIAKASFEKVLKAVGTLKKAPTPEQQTIRNQARLAVSRILYEQGKLSEALDNYNQIERQSAAFNEAIEESIWVSIKGGDYGKSLRQLELMMIKQDDIKKDYRSHLLKGRLLILLKEYAKAQRSFGDVTDAFSPIRDELYKTIQENPDLEAYFQKRIGSDTANLDVNSLLPKSALDAVGDKLGADEAVVLVQEVNTQRRDVEAARRTVEKLRSALSSDMRLEMFPKLQTGYLSAGELLNRSLLAEAKLNDLKGSKITTVAYQRARAERQAAQKLFGTVPVTALDLKNRRRRMKESLRELDKSVSILQTELTSVDAQLVAIRQFQESQNQQKVSKDVASEFERARLLRKELKTLIWTLENERAKLGTHDYAAQNDARIIRAFRKALAQEGQLLERTDPGHQGLRESLTTARSQLDSYRGDIERKVVRLVRSIRDEVEAESRKIDRFEVELRQRERDTNLLGGAIVADTYRRVYGSIRGVVLEADVGMVNMAWKRKLDHKQSIKRYQEQKREEIDQVEAIFNEVTGE